MVVSKRAQKWWAHGLIACLICQLALLLVSLPGQRVQGDEAAFAEFAYWQAQEGHLRSELFRGLLQYEDQILLYHKLFQWIGALVVALFGFHLWPLRAVSLLATGALVWLLWRYFGPHRAVESPGSAAGRLKFLMAVAFLLLAPLTFKFAKYYRPEMIQAALGLGSFLALRNARSRSSARWVLQGGALAGAAMLTHLNGVVYVVAGMGLLVVRREWKATWLFALAAGAVFAVFFVDIIGKTDLFWLQYTGDPTFGEHERTLGGTIGKLLDEHKRLFRKPEIIFTSAMFFTAYFSSVVFQRRRLGSFHVYVAFLIVALGALTPAKTTPYAILLFPFFAIQIAELAVAVIHNEVRLPRWLPVALMICAALFVGHSVAADAINAFTDKQDWVGDNHRAAQTIPPGSRVLAQLDFVLNEVENFQITGLRLPHWWLRDWSAIPYTFDRLARWADSMGMEAIILDWDERRWLVSYPVQVGDTTGSYRLVEQFGPDGLWVWRREQSAAPR